MHARIVKIDATLLITDKGIVSKAVPQASDDIVEFASPLVAVAVFHMLVLSEIFGRLRVAGSDDVPCCSPIAEMIKRGEATCDVIWFIVSCRCRCCEPNLLCYLRQC